MRDASVGFHCPECVKEAARTTRQPRSYRGRRLVRDVGVVTSSLIGINVVVFLLVVLTGGEKSKVLSELWLLPQQIGFGGTVLFPGVSGGAYWQLLTSVFAHEAIWHIGVNMLSLYFLGPTLEQMLGRWRFLGVYLVSGLVGSATVMWFSASTTPTLGASGAIFGLLGALLVVIVKRRLDPRQILFIVVLNLAFTFYGGLNISWQGHVGGLLGGIVLTAIVLYAPRKNRDVIQAVGIVAVGVLAVVVAVVRAAALG